MAPFTKCKARDPGKTPDTSCVSESSRIQGVFVLMRLVMVQEDGQQINHIMET